MNRTAEHQGSDSSTPRSEAAGDRDSRRLWHSERPREDEGHNPAVPDWSSEGGKSDRCWEEWLDKFAHVVPTGEMTLADWSSLHKDRIACRTRSKPRGGADTGAGEGGAAEADGAGAGGGEARMSGALRVLASATRRVSSLGGLRKTRVERAAEPGADFDAI